MANLYQTSIMSGAPETGANSGITASEAHDNASPAGAGPEPNTAQPDGPEPSSDNPQPHSVTPLESNIQPPNQPPEIANPETPAPVPAPTSEAGRPSPSPNAEPATPQPQDPEPELDEPLPLTYWLLTGGTGPPPTTGKFLRMTSERNAVTREVGARVTAREQAVEERNAYIAAWEKEWGPVGVKGLLARVFGSKKRKA
ncbi:hypothetical protein F4811DRAFT_506779 [Daldinia bambusicola]|nr:hypothetical protein F4811DRAFT_506779 [Daldinia bambusicola]